MTDALDAAQRTTLEKLVLRCRHLLETDLAQELERRYGIQKSGVIEAETNLALDASALESRRDLESVVLHLRSEGESARGSIERLVREAAFTHLNRLVAVRIAEAIGMLPETLSGGIESAGFRDFREMAPLAGSDDWDRFRLFLGLCADELAADVPALFDPRNPVLVLQPSVPTLSDLVETIGAAPAAVWDAPDTLGWVYQFFNTGDERRAMREASGAPRDSRELAVRNQFFTPRYVVDFLVQNGLGAHLASALPELVGDLPFLVEAPTEHEQVNLSDVSVLDPACGSGHFLLGAYDVLERAWEHSGVAPAESAPAIISSLWGIDIDPRCTQIAQAAIVFRARRHRRQGDLPQTNVICARALPTGPEADDLVANLPDGIGAAVRTISAELETAPILGPLLKIEERLEHEIRASVFGGEVIEGTLAEGLEGDAFAAIESQVLDALTAISNAATSTAAERLFAAEATDAVRFVEAMRRRYTAVLMNPPFGEPVPETKTYIKAAYPWIPTKDYNLLAAFVGRGLELAEPDHGTCGAITSRAGMFLKTFEQWRADVLLGRELSVLADLGFGVMDQALVEAAAYVLRRGEPLGTGTFIRLLDATDRSSTLRHLCAASARGETHPSLFRVQLEDFTKVPGSPVAYWMNPSLRRLFNDFPPIEGDAAEVRQGLATGDDFRFVRTMWEVDPSRIARSREDTRLGQRWAPFAKGGEYSPYWADIHLVVDWKDDGEFLKSFPGSVIRNSRYYFRAGVTWPERTTSAFGPRVLPSGCVFSHVGYACFAADDDSEMLVYLNSRLVRALMEFLTSAGEGASSGTAARHYLVGIVRILPWVLPDTRDSSLAELGVRLAELARVPALSQETSRNFVAPTLRRHSAVPAEHLAILEAVEEAEAEVADAAGLGASALEELDAICLPLPTNYPTRVDTSDESSIRRDWLTPIDKLVDEVIEEHGGHRSLATKSHFADRRLELLSHRYERPPHQLESVLKAAGSEIIDLSGYYSDLASYLVGCSMGRWDIRIGRDASLAPDPPGVFGPLPILPPGMLLDDEGLPASGAPNSYPLSLPPDRLLLDEAGHAWDIDKRVRLAAEWLLEDTETRLDEMVSILGGNSLRQYFQGQFFKDHLSRYSMSRRAAPIYWQLSVPSRSWSVWVYAPTLSRETLFAIVREVERRERFATDQVRQLSAEREAGGAGRSVSEVAKALDSEEKLAEELRVFRREAERIARLAWVPDLDDGMVLNAAPLADLFPAWKKAAEYRDELRAGKYEWATVARWGDQI